MFTARWWDSTTKLYDYRFRHYSPTLGRFCQTDPAKYIDTMNLYAYCANNPLNWIDPWGLFRFGKRKMHGYERYYRLGGYHVTGFYEDGTGDVADWAGAGRNEDPGKFEWYRERYHDDIMRQAQENVNGWWRKKAYCRYFHNCKHYRKALIKEYTKLSRELMDSQKTSQREQQTEDPKEE